MISKKEGNDKEEDFKMDSLSDRLKPMRYGFICGIQIKAWMATTKLIEVEKPSSPRHPLRNEREGVKIRDKVLYTDIDST